MNAVAKEAAEAAVKAEAQRLAGDAAEANKATTLTEAAEPEKAKAAEGELPAKDKADAAEVHKAKQDEEERLAKEAAEVVATADWEQLAKEATDDASAEAQIQQLLEAAVEAAQAKRLEEEEEAAGLSKADEEELLSKEAEEPHGQEMHKPPGKADTPGAAQDEQPTEANVEVETDRFLEPDEAEEGVFVATEVQTAPAETSANTGGSAQAQPAEQSPRGPEELPAEQPPITAESEAWTHAGFKA